MVRILKTSCIVLFACLAGKNIAAQYYLRIVVNDIATKKPMIYFLQATSTVGNPAI